MSLSRDASAFENYLVYGVDLTKRRIYFGNVSDTEETNDIKESNINLAIRAIDKMLDLSNQPIELHFQSYGGDPYAMMALKDKMLESPCQFKFYGRGRIASAATWIMCVADERYLSEDTTIMIHNGSTYYEEFNGKIPLTDASIAQEEDERLQEILNTIYANNSRMPKGFWDLIVKRDCFMTAREAIMLGLADDIIPHRKRAALRKKRTKALEAHPPKKTIEGLVKRLAKRTRMDETLKELNVQVPKETFEEIPTYDNTAKEIETPEPQI